MHTLQTEIVLFIFGRNTNINQYIFAIKIL